MGRLQGRGHGAEVGPRPAVAITGVGDHDQIGPLRPQASVFQAEAGHHPGSEILQHNVADADQVFNDGLGRAGPEVEGQAAFPPVQGLERAAPLPVRISGIVLGEWTAGESAGPGGVHELNVMGIQLDDLSAQVCQVRSHVRHGEDPAQVQHPDVIQWELAHSSACNFPMRFRWDSGSGY